MYSDVHYLETYAAFEELVTEGKVKSIGVSNFNIKQLQDVLENCKIKPVNNVNDKSIIKIFSISNLNKLLLSK